MSNLYKGYSSIVFEKFEIVLSFGTTDEEKVEMRRIGLDKTLSHKQKELEASIYLMRNDHIIKDILYY
jgi:hypothetical protein